MQNHIANLLAAPVATTEAPTTTTAVPTTTGEVYLVPQSLVCHTSCAKEQHHLPVSSHAFAVL